MVRLLVVFALLAATPAMAQTYLTTQQVDLTKLLPSPPAPGSETEQAELGMLHATQAARTPSEAQATVQDSIETAYAMFGAVLGPHFTAAELPLASKLFTRVSNTEDALVDPAKEQFARKRPYVIDSTLRPSAPLTKTFSWPSGHATQVTMMAIVLSNMLPERRGEIFRRASAYAHNRVVAGVHFPSDVEAGERAGTAIGAVLLDDPAFEAQFAPARSEVRRALGMAP